MVRALRAHYWIQPQLSLDASRTALITTSTLPMTLVAPQLGLKSYTCPHCRVVARHYHWGYPDQPNGTPIHETHFRATPPSFSAAKCEHCGQLCLFVGASLVYPTLRTAPFPNADMPADARSDYDEAAGVAAQSPRAAAALLRLAIQKICIHLGGTGANLNADIADLVRRGLPETVQRSLDVVRVVGNNAVHPGQLDVSDAAIAQQLFPLANIIVEYMISMPKRVEGLYHGLPQGAREAIERRDSKTNEQPG